MDPRQVRLMKLVLLASSLTTIVMLGAAAYRENLAAPWRGYQKQYKTLLVSTAKDDLARDAAQSYSVDLKQLYLPELETIDRCVTCHLGVENPSMVGADPPLSKHPGDYLVNHPVDKFGCTVCHQGEGRATSQYPAHGWFDDGGGVPHVETPLLRGRAVFTSCGRCHAEIDLYGGVADLFAGGEHASGDKNRPVGMSQAELQASLGGALPLALGKSLVLELGCLGCHKYRGRGGVLGPDLTYVGDKTKHDFDFSRIFGEQTVERWLYRHFREPDEVSPGTLMPEMNLSAEEGRALTFYMMSLHRKTAPSGHTPRPSTSLSQASSPVRGETLYGMFCSSCHGADGLGTTMRSGLWPTQADPWGHQWDMRDVVIERRNEMEVMVPSLNHPDTMAVVSDEYLRHVIREGRPGTKMIGWATEGGLSDDEIALLVDFIRQWEPLTSDLASVSSERGDVRVGQALYRANCASCHGAQGEGGIGVSLNSPTFLAVASDDFLRDTIVYGRDNTAMPSWRKFDTRELSDLLAFIRQWQQVRSDTKSVVALCADGSSEAVSVAIGGILYKANCVMCHGVDGGGDLGPSLNTQAFLTAVDNTYLAQAMVGGRPGTAMPKWHHLSNEDLASIVQYLRTWQQQPSKSAAWHAQMVPRGDADAGRSLFVGSCAGCHGQDAEGATGPQLNNPAFLASVSNVMLRDWISHGKEGTEMRSFRKGGQGIAELSDRQIQDIVAYVRSLESASEREVRRLAKSPNGRPEKGAAIYASSCSSCHGDRGQGSSGPALSNRNFLRYASDGFLMATMALGRRGTEMRPVKSGPQSILGLSSDELNDVVAYMRSWEVDRPYDRDTIPHRFVVPWNLARGRGLFASYCAGCHGDEGKGLWAPELNNEGFLAAATDGMLQATIIRGRSGTAMRPFGRGGHGVADLSARDVDDIVAYMRHWSRQTPSPMTIPAEKAREQDVNDLWRDGFDQAIRGEEISYNQESD